MRSCADLLNSLAEIFERYLALPAKAAEAMALWVCFAHTFEAHEVSPRLALVSPVPECGKTTALTILSRLCPNSLMLSNISPAAVYRLIEEFRRKHQPTLLLDEGGTYLENNEAFKGILNSGHRKDGAKVVRSGIKSKNYKVEIFSTWTPIAMAKIGKLQPEWASRSIVIHLQRKRPDEHKDRLRQASEATLEDMARKVAEWAKSAVDQLKDPDPRIPDGLSNRAADNWRPLFAIADLAGEGWPELARGVALLCPGTPRSLQAKSS